MTTYTTEEKIVLECLRAFLAGGCFSSELNATLQSLREKGLVYNFAGKWALTNAGERAAQSLADKSE